MKKKGKVLYSVMNTSYKYKMEVEGLISIIVPVYNVEEYLDCCLNSLISQTYTNIEIILIDDGSTDFSGVKCDEWKNKDSRIVVYHKPNGGLSSARNYGIERANGEYIAFVDSDDYINKEMYDVLLNEMTITNSDMAFCGYYVLEGHNKRSVNYNIKKGKTIILTGKNIIAGMVCGKPFHFTYSVWKNLYKKSVIGKIRFEEGRLYEDTIFDIKLLPFVKKVAVVSVPLYVYRIRYNSIMNVCLNEKSTEDLLRYQRMFIRYYNDEGDKNMLQLARAGILNEVLTYAFSLIRQNNNDECRILLQRFENFLQENRYSIKDCGRNWKLLFKWVIYSLVK